MTITEPAPSLWRNRRYILWLISDTAKGFGGALVSFAIPLIALFVTDDPAQAGVIAGVGMVVRLIMTLLGGVWADRHDRIRMMLLGAALATTISLGFTVLALADALAFTSLLVVEIVLCVRAGAFEPASESALKQIVPDAAMGRAQAANQGRDAVIQLAGGPLGGVILAVGAWLVGVVMTVSFAFAAVMAWMLHRTVSGAPVSSPPLGASRVPDAHGESRPDPAQHAADPAEGLKLGTPEMDAETDAAAAAAVSASDSAPSAPNALREIREGFVWLFSRPDLRGTLLVATIVNLGFSTALTCVTYSLQQQGHSTITIGLLATAAGIAMLIGAIVAPVLVSRLRSSAIVIGGLAVSTVGVVCMTLSHDPLMLGVILGATVFFIPAVNSSLMGYFMVATPTELLGRANSAAGVLGMGALPLAPLIAGFGLTWIGRESTLIVASALCAVSVLLAITNRGLRALPAEAAWSAHARQFAAPN